MKLFMVNVEYYVNGETVSYYPYIGSSYRTATQYLLEKGFNPYPASWTNNKDLSFIKSKLNISTGFRDSIDAKIFEMELDEEYESFYEVDKVANYK